MSNSFIPVALPKIMKGLPPKTYQGDRKTILKNVRPYVQDATKLLEHLDDCICDLMLWADDQYIPGMEDTWDEALATITSYTDRWLRVLRLEFKKVNDGSQPVLQFRNGTRNDIQRSLEFRKVFQAFELAFHHHDIRLSWVKLYAVFAFRTPYQKIRSPDLVSRRPVGEITLNAVLMKQKPRPDRPGAGLTKQEATKWLCDPPFLRSNRSELVGKLRVRSTRIAKREMEWNHETKKVVGHAGTLACLFTNRKLVTGSSQVIWEKLGEVELDYQYPNKPNRMHIRHWFRDVARRGRFAKEEQANINHLVNPPLKLVRDRANLYMTMDKDIVKEDADVLAARDLDRGSSLIPPILSNAYKTEGNGRHMGIAYEGNSWELKQKCPLCTAIFIFPEACIFQPPRENWMIGELGNNTPYCHGCCGEALVVGEALTDLRISHKDLQGSRANGTLPEPNLR